MEGIAYIGLGSNAGDRKQALKQAVQMLGQAHDMVVTAVSSLYETGPVGFTEQGPFLNAVCAVKTELDARALLARLNAVEAQMGRERKVKWGPRVIDLDLLFFGRQVVMNETLSLPHPELVRRAFVLVPLAEIAPEALHPLTGRNMRDTWNEAADEVKRQKVVLLEKAGWHV